MGVPITILDRFNPEELELVGIGSGTMGASIGITKNYRGRTDLAYTDERNQKKCPFSRVIIRNRNPIKKALDKGY